MRIHRRQALGLLAAIPVQIIATSALGQNRDIWSVTETFDALLQDRIRLLDIRSSDEWNETGVAEMAWPVSYMTKGFPSACSRPRNWLAGVLSHSYVRQVADLDL